jgi:hypothetical protein
VEDANLSNGDALMDELKINLNMIGALILDRVGGEVAHAHAIAID